MPKYYVQSGTLRLVTTAANCSGAAIWAVHRVLSPTLPFLRETEPAETESATPHATETPHLAETILVSEQGFERLDAQQFETLAVVAEWNQLLLAIDRLQRRLAET